MKAADIAATLDKANNCALVTITTRGNSLYLAVIRANIANLALTLFLRNIVADISLVSFDNGTLAAHRG